MKKLGILMTLFVVFCTLLTLPVTAEPVHLPQIGNNSIDYDNIAKTEDQIASIGWQYTDDNDYTDLLPYMLNLSKIIDDKWSYKVDKNATGYMTIANITIYKDGSFSTPQIIKPSSIPDYTQKVLDTLNSFAYLPPLPPSYNKLSVNLLFMPDGLTKEEREEAKNLGLLQYIETTNKKIKKSWRPIIPPRNNRYQTAVLFIVKKDGSLDKNKMLIFQSSGNKEFDKSAIDTISKSNYAPLPEKYTNDKLLILFTFNIINSQTIPGQNYLQSSKYPYSNIFNCIYLTKSLRILKNIQNKDGYVWLNAYKITPYTDSYLWRTKVDCRNRLIGIKKSYVYAGNFDYFLKEPVLTNFNTNMQDINKNSDYKAIYDYVCGY